MFFELIGTIIAGVAAALLVWALNRSLKRRLPAWIVPVSAGVAMIGAAVSLEYGWYDRTTATLPQGFVVAQTIEEKSFYRPWTYALPFVTRFVAVDQATMRTHPAQPDQRIVDLVFYGRWARTTKIPMLYDCGTAQSADIVDGIEFDDNGAVIGAAWTPVDPADPVLKAACAEV